MTYAPSFFLVNYSLKNTPLNLSSLMKQLVISILFKEWSGIEIYFPYILFLLFCTLFLLCLLLLKKLLVVLMKRLKVLTKLQEIHLFFILSFTLSVTPLIKTLESSNDFMILIISFISSFEINKVNLLPCSNSSFSTHFYIKFIYCIWI